MHLVTVSSVLTLQTLTLAPIILPSLRNACVDSFRALVLRPEWEKPYYRCSEAWLSLGNHSLALKMNKLGRDLCSSTSELCRQNEQIMVAMENSKR